MVGFVQYKNEGEFTNHHIFGCFIGDKLEGKLRESSEQITQDVEEQIVYASDNTL
jgi:hypothetical protein